MNAPAARIEQGDLVFAREALYNDGCIPDLPDDALLAAPGTRGMVVTIGHAEAAPEEEIYLVRFESDGGALGPPVGCLLEELTQDEAEAKRLATVGV
ncbi:MAG: nitrogen fixation protein NifZ [Rhodocyclaceae bacterium]|nr:nitrogen fixation protein NifZ [Rhodocyclaceae bacterium]